jgi:hypothetical protein
MDRSANRFRRLYQAQIKEAGDAPASNLVILFCGLDHVFDRATDGKPRQRV